MSFGRCATSDQTFAEKFPAAVYEPTPTVDSAEQHRRALSIEAAYRGACWQRGAKRYLFFVLNAEPDVNNPDNPNRSLGSFYDSPAQVMKCVFQFEHYPNDFRFFVIDPDVKAEVEFVSNAMQDFWHEVFSRRAATRWWHRPIMQHGLMTLDALLPPRTVSWLVRFNDEPTTILLPALGSAEAEMEVCGFRVGSSVVCVGPSHFRSTRGSWTGADGQVYNKVGQVIRITLAGPLLLVSFETGEYINLSPNKLRIATRDEIDHDAAQRVARDLRLVTPV